MVSLRVISVAVKHKNADGQEYEVQSLSRIMYLSAWDAYLPATYRGAPPICHFCRQSGHIRAACPVLAKRQCFKCRRLGHTARFCRKEKTPFEETLDEYELSNKAQEETKTADTQHRTKRAEHEKRRGAAPAVNDLAKQPLPLKDVTADNPATADDNTFLVSSEVTMDIDPKTLERTPQGSDASKHAPLDLSFHMHVDSTQVAGISSAPNDFPSNVLPVCRHSVSSTSKSQTTTYHAAHRA